MLEAEQPPTYLTDVLGPTPETVAGRQAWCGLAWEIETFRDAHPAVTQHEPDGALEAALGRCPEWYAEKYAWTHVAGRIANGPSIIATAERIAADEKLADLGPHRDWANRLQHAVRFLDAETALSIAPVGLAIEL